MTTTSETVRQVKIKGNYESISWRWMRFSAFLLIPLVWGHMILQDVVVGVHAMDLGYVADRWANLGWRIYDGLLLGFAFAHGVNGLRQVLNDFVHGERGRKILNWGLFVFWLAIFLFGLIALIAGVNQDFPL
jgi:succinate dehydrogenase / fumarate reductase, membrane anchor subunit